MPSLIDEAGLRAALGRLGALALARGLSIELKVVGGAVMVLGFRSRRGTRDVDVVEASPSGNVLADLVREIAVEQGLPQMWLSESAAKYSLRPSGGPELAIAPYIPKDKYGDACAELADLWKDVDRGSR